MVSSSPPLGERIEVRGNLDPLSRKWKEIMVITRNGKIIHTLGGAGHPWESAIIFYGGDGLAGWNGSEGFNDLLSSKDLTLLSAPENSIRRGLDIGIP